MNIHKPKHILSYYARSHTGYLHARGAVATDKLIELLDCQKREEILEIGFGTGATIARLAGLYPKSLFTGVDVSEDMSQAASKRLKFCGLADKVNLSRIESGERFAFGDQTFDKIYAESIFAIQEGDALKDMLDECHRILKPGGVLLFNETIWLDHVEQEKAQRINLACKEAFGIIQANSMYTHFNHWRALLKELGFAIEQEIKVDQLKHKNTKTRSNINTRKSALFSAIGKLRSSLSPALRAELKSYNEAMKKIMSTEEQLMEGVIFLVKKSA